MSTVRENQAATPRLSPEELKELKEWLEDFFEDQLERTEEVKARLDQSKAEILAGQCRTRRPWLWPGPRFKSGPRSPLAAGPLDR